VKKAREDAVSDAQREWQSKVDRLEARAEEMEQKTGVRTEELESKLRTTTEELERKHRERTEELDAKLRDHSELSSQERNRFLDEVAAAQRKAEETWEHCQDLRNQLQAVMSDLSDAGKRLGEYERNKRRSAQVMEELKRALAESTDLNDAAKEELEYLRGRVRNLEEPRPEEDYETTTVDMSQLDTMSAVQM